MILVFANTTLRQKKPVFSLGHVGLAVEVGEQAKVENSMTQNDPAVDLTMTIKYNHDHNHHYNHDNHHYNHDDHQYNHDDHRRCHHDQRHLTLG